MSSGTPPNVVIEIGTAGTPRTTYVTQPPGEDDDVVTDVGDVRWIIPVSVVEELIDQWVTLLTLSAKDTTPMGA